MSTSPAADRGPLTMQDAILALQRFWTDRGCMIVQPFNTEVGAGTANPATALRVLGPEPWRVAYVEPSVRPDDSRYGDNPNRLQTHTQFQVILKPDPGNPQELYLDSLRALGIDLDAHDVRFVEDNWASPALGAWGLGWEVWLDGMEITQFTYFQQAGGIQLDPVSVELTYGLERILMALQGVAHFKDIAYADGITYGEVFAQSEYEMSRYYLDDADVQANRELFERYASEAQRMIDLGLPVPAYTYVLRCSHTFNVLDARGAISTTERATAFRTMRTLTHDVAEQWVKRRDELGHPLGVADPAPVATPTSGLPVIDAPADLLFEVGVEELPWTDVRSVGDWLRRTVAERLDATRLEHGEVTVAATPRRLVVTVADVAPGEPALERFARGPKAEIAFDADGAPTKAASGFARGQGVEAAELETVDVDGIAYVGVTRTDAGRSAAEVLSQLLAGVVAELRSTKNMRWADPELTFSRPIRWLLALLGDQPLPVTVSGLASGTTTRVLRTADPAEVAVTDAAGYGTFLERHDIVLDRDHRRGLVVAGAQALAVEVGGDVDVTAQAELIEEITDLIESPTPLLGSFDARYTSLPAPVLTTVMRKHQRYLAVTDDAGELLPYFVTVANGACDVDLVRRGNEAVLRARYEDASFFFEADLGTTPADFHQRLDQLNFETQLGTMADRARRIRDLAAAFADRLDLDPADRAAVARAAELAKFDLASQMVVELSSLAGTMAGEYARRAGESEAVATALVEMEKPRTGLGDVPGTDPGRVLSLADRFDLLTGMMAIGNAPTGSSDPFGVRRAAIGIVNVLRSAPQLEGLSLRDGVASAAAELARQGIAIAPELVDETVALATRRFELQLLDAGHVHAVVRAVLPKAERPGIADRYRAELEELVPQESFQQLVEAVQRVLRILPDRVDTTVSAARLTDPTEQSLAAAVAKLEQAADGRELSPREFAAAAAELPAVIHPFFDAVLVMDPDPDVRAARLALLGRITGLAQQSVDWSAL